MSKSGSNDIVIVSDLHLSAGYDPRTGAYNRNEDFFYDAAFARFLADLSKRAVVEGRHWRLVILGDFFDFLQVDVPEAHKDGPRPDVSEAATIAKLEKVVAGHAEFFQALGEFAAQGFNVDIVVGNHDIEMIRPRTQEHFKQLLVEKCGMPEIAARISFHPWILYVPGVLYAEHGQQYEHANSFATLLTPYVDDDVDVIDLPLGSYFVTYLFNRIESMDPFADNIRPVNRYLLWSFRVHPILAFMLLGKYFRFLFNVWTRVGDVPAAETEARCRAYREEYLRAHAEVVGLSHRALVAIDSLAAVPAMRSRTRLLRSLLLEPLLPLVPLAGAFVTLWIALNRLRSSISSFLLLAAGLAGLVWRERGVLRPAAHPLGYLHRAALSIHRILRKEGKEVPVYVFGHTHNAEQYPLVLDGAYPRYLNTGTWTPVVPSAFELLGARERFSFVQVTTDPETGEPIAHLLHWNDAANRQEPLPLLTV